MSREGSEVLQTSPPRGISKRHGWKTYLALALLISAVVLAGASAVLPWWELSSGYVAQSPTRSHATFYVWGTCSGALCPGYQTNTATNITFAATGGLVFVGLTLSIVSLALFVSSISRPQRVKASLPTGVAGSILLLVSPIEFDIALPSALPWLRWPLQGFSGSWMSVACSVPRCVSMNWGAGAGWFVAFAASAFLFVSTVFAFILDWRSRNPSTRAREAGPGAQTELSRPRGRLNWHFRGRPMAVLILLILSTALIIGTMLLPWWSITIAAGGGSQTTSWYLNQRCSSGAQLISGCQPLTTVPQLPSVPPLDLSYTLVISALALVLAALALFVLSAYRPWFRFVLAPIGFVGSSLMLIAPVYLFFALPGGVLTPGFSPEAYFGSDFAGSWGAGWGWYLAFAAFVVSLATTQMATTASSRLLRAGKGTASEDVAGATTRSPPNETDQRFGPKTVAALVILILAVVLLVLSINTMWWAIYGSAQDSSYWSLGFMCQYGSCVNYQGFGPVQNLFGLASTLIWLGLGLAFVTLALMVASLFSPRFGRAVGVAGAAGSLLILAAPLYLYFALPAAMQAGHFNGPPPRDIANFFGSVGPYPGSFYSLTYSWGAGAGWYSAFVTAVVLLVGTLTAIPALRHLRRLGDFKFSRAGQESAQGANSTLTSESTERTPHEPT